jgi:glutaredoxin
VRFSNNKKTVALAGRLAVAFALVIGLSSEAIASPDDATVTTFGTPGCDHSMTTNHFALAPGEVFEHVIDLSECVPAHLGGFLYFGYKTTRNSSRPLEIRDGIALRIIDVDTGQEIDYEALFGYNGAGKMEQVFIQVDRPRFLILEAENTNRRKSLTVRLRTECGL